MNNGGQIPWNAKLICETFKISCLMGRRPMEDVLENLSKDQSFRLVHWLSITLFLREVLPGLFFGYALYAGGIWKGHVLVADLEELETMDASEIYS